ncbi:class I SAM-dependent methyltransferase, partial [Shimia sp.]|uniref:N5-glutamine methyltransferase family protein n=1 Tax=Shimia sp. TaxID=1954381 RepID=UPI0035643653
MILREALTRGIRHLREAGIADAARDARALLAEAAGIDVARLTLEADRELADPQRFEALLARRAANEPVSKILGRRQFWGRDFEVTRDTLDPRPETETLIAAALELGPVSRFADLGTGTGIIAVSLLCDWPGARAVATDVSPPALAVAGRNAARHGVGARLELCRSADVDDWL